ncbi:MAG: hypothetical protein R2712_03120 [Vicinamibacterales bacterium]
MPAAAALLARLQALAEADRARGARATGQGLFNASVHAGVDRARADALLARLQALARPTWRTPRCDEPLAKKVQRHR